MVNRSAPDLFLVWFLLKNWFIPREMQERGAFDPAANNSI
jgi:hypothetical protein